MGKVENEGMPVVRLDRQLKYQGNILKIYEDTVLANGHQESWTHRMSQRSSVLTENWRRKLVSAPKNWNIS